MTDENLLVRIDGRLPLSADLVAQVSAVCDHAEDLPGAHAVIVEVSGVPARPGLGGRTAALVSRWERVLRRLERLPAVTVGVATGDCGGLALDALLATDYRIAGRSVRLIMPVEAGATWPGMALYRLIRQSANAGAVRQAVLFGTPLDAREALALHLVHDVTDDLPGALARVTTLSGALSGPELAVRRQLMFEAATTSYEDALGAHLAACDRALRTAAEAAR